MHLMGIEWAALASGMTVVSTAERSWVHTSILRSPFARPMTGPGSLLTTRNLLDAAVKLGWAAARRIPEPPFTVSQWVYRLAGFYQTTHATPLLMREAAERFARADRFPLAWWAENKAQEEHGHDELVLRDLRALGFDANAVVAVLAPPIAAGLVRYFERQVCAEEPVGCVGYAYALERLALEVDEGYIARVEAGLPRGVRATRCLRVHSATGSDRKHVQEIVELVATLSPAERTRIALACYETAVRCYESGEGEPLAEEALELRLASLKIQRRM